MSYAQKAYNSGSHNVSEKDLKRATTVGPKSFEFEKSTDRKTAAMQKIVNATIKTNPPSNKK